MWKNEQEEDAKLCIAALQSLRTGRITPLLKEELKYHIQSRRMSEGKSELVLDPTKRQEQDQTLRPEEIEKIKKRKEQNRKASEKFRNKKKTELQHLNQLVHDLQKRNADLKQEVENLQAQRDDLYNNVTLALQMHIHSPPANCLVTTD